MNQWFTGDTHAFHKNITSGVSTWPGGGIRQFPNEVEMTETMARRINTWVLPKDILWHVGDWSFGGLKNIFKFREMINCQDIRIILGNHDHHIYNDKDNCRKLFTKVYPEGIFARHINRQYIVISHYAMRIWNHSHHNSWNLYGHSHGSLNPDWGKSMDVGVDTNSLVPYHFDDIKDIMSGKEANILDHHNEKTT